MWKYEIVSLYIRQRCNNFGDLIRSHGAIVVFVDQSEYFICNLETKWMRKYQIIIISVTSKYE